jgi:uncharacterized repeat protein (TIGR03943 family)
MKSLTSQKRFNLFLPLLDVFALLGWGILLLKYWFTGQLRLLIHPNYFLLVFITGLIILVLSVLRLWQFWRELRHPFSSSLANPEHINLLPQGWSSSLLLITAILGILIKPGVLTSQVALQRGVSDSLPLTREEPQAFRTPTKPEERTLIEWVRTLNTYPEPDAYQGQQAKITGFVVHLPPLGEDYIYLSRFILTCCAVDAYPVGMPVKLPQPRSNYPPDSWLEVEGEMITEMLPNLADNKAETQTNKRQLVLKARALKPIPTPKNPYEYQE